MDKTTRIRNLINDFENNKITGPEAVVEINKYSTKKIDEEWLNAYWNSISLDEFISLIITEPIRNWQQLTDEDSIQLIEEILEDISNNALISRNSEALERRYSKPEGTILNLIFHKDLNDPSEIMIELKKDSRIIL